LRVLGSLCARRRAINEVDIRADGAWGVRFNVPESSIIWR
jgi:hypothetical protein